MNTIHGIGFEPVRAVGSLLSGLTVPWWITGGWAIDLAVGHVTRDHADVDVMMLERDEHALRGLPGVGIQLIADGRPPGPWPAGRLVLRGKDLPLPTQVIPASAVGTIWVYKKGSHVFIRRLADITRYWHGIPFVAPEVVLLIKARPGLDRPGTDNDQRDFEAALPILSAEQRSWLKDAIERPSWLKDAIERQPRPPRQHRWTPELATRSHPPG